MSLYIEGPVDQVGSFFFSITFSFSKMRLSTFIFSSLLSLTVSAAPSAPSKVPDYFTQRIVFTPPSDYNDPRTLYARTAEFENGNLLATWENYSPEGSTPESKVYFPIYKSTDGGNSWNEVRPAQFHHSIPF